MDSPAPTSARPRRWIRRLLIALGLVVALIALAPLFLGPFLRGFVVGQLEERLGVKATVQGVSFAWPARLRVYGVELADAEGAPLASLDELQASLALLPLLGGALHAEVELVYPELHLARSADGPWNWERSLAKLAASANANAKSPAPADEGSLPELELHLNVRDGHVVVHAAHGETTLGDIALNLDVHGLEQPAPYRLSLALRGPDGAGGPHGAGGRLALEGSFTAAPRGRLEVLDCAGEARLTLAALDLVALGPALSALAAVEDLHGVLEGKAEFTLAAGLALSGALDVGLSEFALRGPRTPDEPARIARITLRGSATQQGDGAGTQELSLTADEFLSLVYHGRSQLPASGAGEVGGQLALTADLGRVSALARGWVPIQEGVVVAGRVQHELEFGASLRGRTPLSAHLTLQGGIDGLAARDGQGLALDLAGLAQIAVALEASADLEHGTLSVKKATLNAGPVSFAGELEAADLAFGPTPAARPTLRSGKLHLEADLEHLRGTLAQVLELSALSFGGRLSADATLEGGSDALALHGTLDGRALNMAGAKLAELRGDIDARRTSDGGLSGTGTLHLGAFELALAEQKQLSLPSSTVQLALRESTGGRGEHSLGFETQDGALELVLNARSERTADELTLRTTLRLDARVAQLAELAAPFAPVQPGLSGNLHGEGDLHATLRALMPTQAGGKLAFTLTDLALRDAAGKTQALTALAQTTLGLEAELNAATGVGELRSFSLGAGGLKCSASGRVTGLTLGTPPAALKPELEQGHVELEADLARLGQELARVLDLGWSVGGGKLSSRAELSTRGGRIEAKGDLAAARIVLERADGAPLTQSDVALDFDLGYDANLGSLHVRAAHARSQTASLALSGTLNELGDPTRARGTLQLELEGTLERLLGDLDLEPPAAGRHTAGALHAKLTLDGNGGTFHADAQGGVEHFRLELAPTTAGEAPLVIEEPAITLDCQARVALAALDVELEKLTLTSGLARGGVQGRVRNLRALGTGPDADVRFEKLSGEFAYVPERLGALLAPFLPGKLTGTEEQRVTFTLDGRVRDFSLAALLAGSQARIELGLGRFERPEIQLGGNVVVESRDEKLLLRGDLAANGGTLKLDGTLDLSAEKPRSKLTVTARELRANSGLAPLLALVHPIFAGAPGSLDGLIALNLDLTYDGALTLEGLQAGWAKLPKEPLNGTGRLELSAASLKGSPLLARLAEFGVDTQKTLDVRPIEFTIQKGRVRYAKPWTWNLAGTETSFSGSLGLDQSLDLAWNVPITDKLIEHWGFLSALKGETLSIPLRGTVSAPKLEADALLKDLAAKAAKKELEGRLGLGGGVKGEDPAELLTRADELWKMGQKSAAAALYVRLKDDFKLTLTYALNKDRIKDRAKYKEPPK